jgi:hypothetical protein
MSKYLAADGVTVVDFSNQGEFPQVEAERLASIEPAERFVEPITKQNLPDTAIVYFWRVRVGATSQDRARLAGKDCSNACALTRPGWHVGALRDADHARGETTHRLQFTSPLVSYHASFTPSVKGDAVYVRTFYWKFEDEYHHWLPADKARELYQKMVAAGFEPVPAKQKA